MLAKTRNITTIVRPRASTRGIAGGGIGFLHGGAEMAGGGGLGAKGLHHADGGEIFGGVGARLGERILRRAGPLADQAARGHQRQDDDGNGNEHGGGKFWARIDHHRDRAGEQKEIAQRDRRRGTEGGLHLGRVGGEPGHEFAGSRGVEKGGVETAKMFEHI